jgi:hypothetical protein
MDKIFWEVLIEVLEIDKKYFGVFIFNSGSDIERYSPTGGERYSLPPSGLEKPS